jgi:SAM-dependent methyltransferase
LLTPEGQTVLAAATALEPTDATLLQLQTRLRKQFPADLVKAAIETAILRRKAAAKFSRADRMYFTREAFEQSSSEVIAAYRAKRFASFERVADLCCGIGGDAIGLAQATRVVAVDNDAVRLAMAKENLRAYDHVDRANLILGNARTTPLSNVAAAFADPDRRADGKRHIRLREYVPSVDELQARFASGFPIGIKVAPGVSWDELDALDAEKEFISVDGELKECVLWFRSLKTTHRCATILPGGATLAADRGREAPTSPAAPPARYLYEPDPAIIRSGLVAKLAQNLDARLIDDHICYLSGDRVLTTPFATCYEILESMPFHARRIGELLRASGVGHVTIMKRGSAVDVDALRRGWRLQGSNSRIVILTMVLAKPWALIARPVAKTSIMTAE